MNEYHKIQSIFKRRLDGDRTLIEGDWTLPEFEFLANNVWQFTEKVDGTNIRVGVDQEGGVVFGGRTESAQIPAQLVARLNETFIPMAEKLREVFGHEAMLCGEGYGAKIQKGGGNYRADQDFVLFDVRVGNFWLQRADVEDVAHKLGLDVVPIIGEGTLHDAVEMAKRGITSFWGDFGAEGVVARPKVELQARNGSRIIAKIKTRDFK